MNRLTKLIESIKQNPLIALGIGFFIIIGCIIISMTFAHNNQSLTLPGGFSLKTQDKSFPIKTLCEGGIKEIDTLIDNSIKAKLLPKQYELINKCKENQKDIESQQKLYELNESIMKLIIIKYSVLARCEEECSSGKLVSSSLPDLKLKTLKIIENQN